MNRAGLHRGFYFVMLDTEDLKLIASRATELNAMLQQISRYSDLSRQHKGDYKYIDMLGERIGLASRTAQSIFDHVTGKIFAGTMGRLAEGPKSFGLPAFSVVRSPADSVAKPHQIPCEQKDPRSFEAASSAKQPVKAPLSSSGQLAEGQKIRNPNGPRELILIVEDEPEVADLAAEMLAEEGYKAIIAKDGFEALDIYRRIGNEIGLVILDFFLPIIDGDAVFDELRELNPKIDVVLSSGFAEQSKLGNMLAQGLRGFMPKPYTREKLLQQVRSALDVAR